MPPLVTVIYYEREVLGFTDRGAVWRFSPPYQPRWREAIRGPNNLWPEAVIAAVPFEGYILVFGARGSVWKLTAHCDLPTCDWVWCLIGVGASDHGQQEEEEIRQ